MIVNRYTFGALLYIVAAGALAMCALAYVARCHAEAHSIPAPSALPVMGNPDATF